MWKLRRNPPLAEVGLLTRAEFEETINPDDIEHPPSAYDASLEDLNSSLYAVGSAEAGRHRFTLYVSFRKPWESDEQVLTHRNFVISAYDTYKPLAVLHEGTLYHDRFWPPRKLPDHYQSGRGVFETLPIERAVEVKYPEDYVKLVSDVKAENLARYNYLLQRVRLGDEVFEIRSEGEPVTDKGQTIAALNQDGLRVASAQNEWGSTLVWVAREYRGRGLGDVLLPLWTKLNPSFQSGGMTRAGRESALRMWEHRVRELLAFGVYSGLIAQGKLTRARVQDILAGLRGTRETSRIPAKGLPEPERPKLLVHLDDIREPTSFVLYDARFLQDQDDKYIYGFGFLRDSDQHGTFFYRLEYERPYQVLATTIGMQMARVLGEKVYVGAIPGDVIELSGVPGVVGEGGYAWLTFDALPLQQHALREKQVRKAVDKYDEILYSLLEQANAKWA